MLSVDSVEDVIEQMLEDIECYKEYKEVSSKVNDAEYLKELNILVEEYKE